MHSQASLMADEDFEKFVTSMDGFISFQPEGHNTIMSEIQ